MNVLRTAARARAAAFCAALALGLPAGAAAHDGHDHGAPAPGEQRAASPRFATAAGPFELVGVLDGRRLVLWLDRADDTAPIAGAAIELDVGGRSAVAVPEGDVYVVEFDTPPAPGVLPIAATVVAGADADVLAAELRIEPPAAGPARGAAVIAAGPSETVRVAAAAGVAALLAGGVGWLAGRRRAVARG